MREFEMYEIFKSKCIVCGCRNKVHTTLLDYDGKFIGYTLKCCACGNVKEFLLNIEQNGVERDKPISTYRQGKQTCLMPSHCPRRKQCKLYKKNDDTNSCNSVCCSCKKICTNKTKCKKNDVTITIVQRPDFL